MLQSTGERTPLYITMYYVSLALLVVSLPLSKFTMSLFQFSTLFFWLWHGVDTQFISKYKTLNLLNPFLLLQFCREAAKGVLVALFHKFREFFRNKAAMAIASVLLLHVIGLIYTTDFNYAFKDLRTKLPIFILPLFIATGPRLSTKVFYLILGAFIAAVVGGSIYRLILFMNLPVADSRALAAHTSHIRYSLNAVFAVFIGFYFIYSKGVMKVWLKIVLLVASIWILVFMTFMNYSTGMLLFVFISVLLGVFFAFRIRSIYLRISVLFAISTVLILPLFYFLSVGYAYFNPPRLNWVNLRNTLPEGIRIIMIQ